MNGSRLRATIDLVRRYGQEAGVSVPVKTSVFAAAEFEGAPKVVEIPLEFDLVVQLVPAATVEKVGTCDYRTTAPYGVHVSTFFVMQGAVPSLFTVAPSRGSGKERDDDSVVFDLRRHLLEGLEARLAAALRRADGDWSGAGLPSPEVLGREMSEALALRAKGTIFVVDPMRTVALGKAEVPFYRMVLPADVGPHSDKAVAEVTMARSDLDHGDVGSLASAFEPWEHDLVLDVLRAHGVRVAKPFADINFDESHNVDLATVNRLDTSSILPLLVKAVCLELSRDGEWVDGETSEVTKKLYSLVSRNSWDDPGLLEGLQTLADKEKRGVVPVSGFAERIGWEFKVPFFETLARRAEVFPYAAMTKSAAEDHAPAP